MERVMSVEERIKRAEDIYARRQSLKNGIGAINKSNTVKEKSTGKKRVRKMVIQIVVCLCIYGGIYLIQNRDYVFSADLLNKVDEILSYDINFEELYNDAKQNTMNIINGLGAKKEEQNNGQNNETNNQEQTNENQNEENIGGAVEEMVIQSENTEEKTEPTQTEIDLQTAINTTSFIKPVEGVLSSAFGQRESSNESIPKNHTGIDIAADLGTKIKSATSGEVVLYSTNGDYGNHLKIQNGEVSIVYAHCSNMYVKQGDKVEQGQEIAEVGSTGNSTGPHLHFEIRVSERVIDPQLILQNFGVLY